MISKRQFIFGACLSFAMASASQSNELDHVANASTIGVTFGAIQQDPENPANSILSLQVKNRSAVNVLLREVRGDVSGEHKLAKSRSVFGRVVWQDVEYVQINAGKTLAVELPKFKLKLSNALEPGETLTLDFGPKGEVAVIYNGQ